MKSSLTLTITIEHGADLPFDAQSLAAKVTAFVAEQAGITGSTRGFGRRSFVGPEDGPRVETFLQSAVFTTDAKPRVRLLAEITESEKRLDDGNR